MEGIGLSWHAICNIHAAMLRSHYLYLLPLVFWISVSALCAAAQSTSLVSVDSQGNQGNGTSRWPSISADGQRIAFYSDARNLVLGGTSVGNNVYLHNRQTGTTVLVSVTPAGLEGDRASISPAISANGAYVAFLSSATNLESGDTNLKKDVYVYEHSTGFVTRVSESSFGVEGNDDAGSLVISGDGRYVAFYSAASNLVPNDMNGLGDFFLHDRNTGQTKKITSDFQGGPANGTTYRWPSISADGRFISFESDASNLVSQDTNMVADIFVYDALLERITRVNVDSTGGQANDASVYSSLSLDGTQVAFSSAASNLVAGDTNGWNDVFVHNLTTGQTVRASLNGTGGEAEGGSFTCAISADGRFVTFYSWSSTLVLPDTNGNADIFLKDLWTDEITRLSDGLGGFESNGDSFGPEISAGGKVITYTSRASNLTFNDSNVLFDIFVREQAIGASENSIVLVSAFEAVAGSPVGAQWFGATPNAPYWVLASTSAGGTLFAGHRFNLSGSVRVLDTGLMTSEGSGDFTSQPVPMGLSGTTIYLEVGSRVAPGAWEDSTVQRIVIR